MARLVCRFRGNSLYEDSAFFVGMGRDCVATWGSEHSAVIDSRAYAILERVCGDDVPRLRRYLRAILQFEIHHSDDVARHAKRTPTELEILQVLMDEGYFR